MKTRHALLSALLLSLSLGLSACGKKDSNFMKSKSGAVAKDPVATQQSEAEAQVNGVSEFDVHQISLLAYETVSVSTTISVNGNQWQIWTTHADPYNPGVGLVASGSGQISGFDLQVDARCMDAFCKDYYLLLSLSKNGARIQQLGVKYSFEVESRRFYVKRSPTEWMSSLSELVYYMDGGA